MSAGRAAFRLARRDALRHRWRSLLIIVLILAPVAAAAGVDVIYRTQTSVELDRERVFGGADAIITVYPTAEGGAGLTQSQIEDALPTGSRVVFERHASEDVFLTPGHLAQSSIRITDNLGDPLTRANGRLKAGRVPGDGAEIAISPKLADRLGLRGDGLGSTIGLRDGTTATVTGIVQDPFCLSCPLVVARPGSAIGRSIDAPVTGTDESSGSYYVDLPPNAADASAGRLAPLGGLGPLLSTGASIQMRSETGDYEIGLGDLGRASEDDLKAVALVTLVAGLGLLEVVLLAGTAFAVGARRQTRDLGMIAAQGGSPGDLRRVVLAQGLLLGLVGAVAGVLAGIGGVVAAKPLLERINNEVMVGVHFGWVEVLVVAMVGVGSGLLAALFPAITAGRRPTVDALASRFPVPTARSKWAPLFGAVLIAGGVTLSLMASYLMSGGESANWFSYGPPEEIAAFPGDDRIDDTSGSIAILVGVFIVVGGLLLLAPALLAALAKLAARMPATLRLATRDAARHRHRTGPATAAIAVAVGGAVAISCLIASSEEGNNRFDADAVPDRVIALDKQNAVDASQVETATAAVQQVIPGATVVQVVSPVLSAPGDSRYTGNPVDDGYAGGGVPADYYPNQMYVVTPVDYAAGSRVGLGDPALVALASGRVADPADAKAAFDAGKAVVFDSALIDSDGKITIETGRFDENGDNAETVTIPAVTLSRSEPYNALPQAFVPKSFVTAQKWDTVQNTTLLSYPPESRDQAGAAIAAAEALGIPVITSAEEKDYTRLIRVGLTGAAALIALLGVAMCVALSAAEGRPDLATLSAIGAPPGRRRRLAGAQALVLAVIGVVLGLGFGFYFARAARPATGAAETIVPWSDLMLTVAAVPLLAVLVAMLGSIGRVPLTRRAD